MPMAPRLPVGLLQPGRAWLVGCRWLEGPSEPHGLLVCCICFFCKARLIDKTYPRRHTANPPKEIHRVLHLLAHTHRHRDKANC
jgi:hypothetical protein